MFRFLVLVAILFAVALGFHQLKDTDGEVALTVGETAYAVDLVTALIGLGAAFLLIAGLFWFIRELLRSPGRLSRGWRNRNQERGRTAISEGLIAIAAGDTRAAERAMLEASKRTPDLPLARLLQAQTAQIKGDRAAARQVFRDMTEDPRTRIAGLRGLYVEAEREGEMEAAHHIAELAREESPSTPWAARALLRHQVGSNDWDGALKTLSGAADGRVLDKRTARRHRAVVLAGQAIQLEASDPDRARHAALEAHELAPDLVPAAAAAGRLLSRHGDIRRATRVLETTWKSAAHPEIAEAYLHVRAGDSAADRLKRAEAIHRLRGDADEGRLAVARAAIDARDFARARQVLTPVLTQRPTQRALTIMAELEEAETGDRGRAREWTARALRAPRDPVWTADGVVLESWAPASPVTGRIDTVEWKVPVAELEAPGLDIDAAELEAAPPPEPITEPVTATEPPLAEAAGTEPAEAEVPMIDITPRAPETTVLPADPGPTSAGAGLLPHDGNGVDHEPAEAKRPGPSSGPDLSVVPPSVAEAPADGDRDPEGEANPPLPDDPGVNSEEPAEQEKRRFRMF